MILTKRQCKLLLKELYQNKVNVRQKKLAVRNLTMTLIMLDAGLRTTEVVNLMQSDLIKGGIVSGTLLVTRGMPQGHGLRDVDLSERIKYFVRQMDQCGWFVDSGKPGSFAFYSVSSFKHITATQFRRIINAAGLNALGYPIRPNELRRTCAAKLLKQTDRKTVQKVLDYKTDQDSFFYY